MSQCDQICRPGEKRKYFLAVTSSSLNWCIGVFLFPILLWMAVNSEAEGLPLVPFSMWPLEGARRAFLFIFLFLYSFS